MLPPLASLAFRFIRPRFMPWWAVMAVSILGGWALILVAAALSETPDRGAPKVFALFFGWAYSLVWLVPWLVVYGIVQLVFRRKSPGGRD